MDIDTMEKATETEGHLSNGSKEKQPSLTFEQLSQYFCMPINQAARELNVGLTHLKRRCRELGIPRWPGRKVKSRQRLIDYVQGKEDTAQEADMTRRVIEKLLQKKKEIEETPDVMLDKETVVFRQACYKEKYVRNKKKQQFRRANEMTNM